MTRIIFMTTMVLMLCTGTSFAQGVDFRETAFDEVLRQSAAENKPVFLYCYTAWCGPCKNMTQNVFPRKEMGDYFNERFISVKIDMEKGEGPEVAERFGIRVYPSFVIVNPDGTMRHLVVGGGDGLGFIEKVEEAFDETKSLNRLARRFEDGDRDREFLVGYMKMLKDRHNTKAADVAQVIFEGMSDPERLSPENWNLLSDTDLSPAGSPIEKYLFANLDAYRKAIGREMVDERIAQPYSRKLMMVMAGRDKNTSLADIDRIVGEITSFDIAQGPMLLSYAEAVRLYLSGDRDAGNYKGVLKNSMPETNPFVHLYQSLKPDLSPAQLSEWKAWGEEIAAASNNPHFKQYMEMLLSRE